MQIWVDGDACPAEVKEILYRAAQKREVQITLVANQSIRIPSSPRIHSILVSSGMNVADRRIVELVAPGDLVITADIPLASAVVAKGAQALDPRGGLYSEANIGERLSIRNLMDEMRGAGRTVRGPSNFSPQDRQAFANQLDRWISANKKKP